MQIPEDIIIRSIQKNATEEELRTLHKWLAESKENKAFYFQLEEIWATRQTLSKDSIQESWEMLVKQIEKQPQQHVIPKNKRTIAWWHYAAAVLVGVVIASTIWLGLLTNESLNHSTIQNMAYNNSGVQSIILPDQSEVWLNEKSCLAYPDQFKGKERLVALEGKAYFDIKNSHKKPFLVQIGEVSIEVTGTEFFVEAASQEESCVTLISGKVNLNYKDSNGKQTSTPLIPGEQAYINRLDSSIEIKTINTDYYVAWKDGTYRFTDERLEKITAILAQHYDLEIQVAPSVRDRRFTGRVRPNEDIEDVLRSIKSSYPISYRIRDKKIRITE